MLYLFQPDLHNHVSVTVMVWAHSPPWHFLSVIVTGRRSDQPSRGRDLSNGRGVKGQFPLRWEWSRTEPAGRGAVAEIASPGTSSRPRDPTGLAWAQRSRVTNRRGRSDEKSDRIVQTVADTPNLSSLTRANVLIRSAMRSRWIITIMSKIIHDFTLGNNSIYNDTFL